MKRYKRRLSKTMLIVTLALPIMMCVVIKEIKLCLDL